jgi:hypothetical protein
MSYLRRGNVSKCNGNRNLKHVFGFLTLHRPLMRVRFPPISLNCPLSYNPKLFEGYLLIAQTVMSVHWRSSAIVHCRGGMWGITSACMDLTHRVKRCCYDEAL